ncbi:MAG: hypothetical protein ABWX88_08655 [Pseudoxanthomonas sp.]
MKVKELVAELNHLDPELQVLGFSLEGHRHLPRGEVPCQHIESVDRVRLVRAGGEIFMGRIAFDNEKGEAAVLTFGAGDA